ncbi:putative quinol monooxygenase [Amnibacterium sp. CER49]|uniref:putative quinol monooxygenase n=1 Tax=Amnibacterium sp. CER49 TaxID=3039161 RepID=UPI00244C120A|nr:putative quinol monooxygenase [Amnibacterium sp. CER49]MDH2444836.1 putative quinol monooxygenase [Amnibacterium sp. CER49]
MSPEPVTLLVTLQARAEAGKRLRDELALLAARSRADAGCIRYDVLEETDVADRFVLCEEWLDEAALVEHNTLPHVGSFLAASGDLLAGPMQVKRLRRAS